MKSINWPINLRLRRAHVLILSILVIQVIPLAVAQAGNESISVHPRSYNYVGPFTKLIHIEELRSLYIVSYDYRSDGYGLFKMNYQGIALKQESDYDLYGDIMDYCYDGEDKIYLVTESQLLVYNIRSSVFERIYTSLDNALLGSYDITRCYADSDQVYLGTQLNNLIVLNLSDESFHNYVLSHEYISYWEVKALEGSETHVIVGTDAGIIVIVKSSMFFSYYRFGTGYEDNIVNSVAIDGSTVYIGTQNNLYSMYIPTRAYIEVAITFQLNEVYDKRIINTLVDNTGLLIVATDNYIYSFDGLNTNYEYCNSVQSIVHVSSENKYYAVTFDSSYYIYTIDPIQDNDPKDDVHWLDITYAQALTTPTYRPPPDYINTGFIPVIFLAVGSASLGYVIIKMKRH